MLFFSFQIYCLQKVKTIKKNIAAFFQDSATPVQRLCLVLQLRSIKVNSSVLQCHAQPVDMCGAVLLILQNLFKLHFYCILVSIRMTLHCMVCTSVLQVDLEDCLIVHLEEGILLHHFLIMGWIMEPKWGAKFDPVMTATSAAPIGTIIGLTPVMIQRWHREETVTANGSQYVIGAPSRSLFSGN